MAQRALTCHCGSPTGTFFSRLGPRWPGFCEILNYGTHRIHGAAIYGNIYHQYTPLLLVYIPAPWIRHGVYIYYGMYCKPPAAEFLKSWSGPLRIDNSPVQACQWLFLWWDTPWSFNSSPCEMAHRCIDGLPFLKMGGFSMAMAQITRGYQISISGRILQLPQAHRQKLIREDDVDSGNYQGGVLTQRAESNRSRQPSCKHMWTYKKMRERQHKKYRLMVSNMFYFP